jgi:predicted DNA-binding antitoxin AbrB/MazE fold protein
MSYDIHAVYEHGLLRPLDPLTLPEGTRVLVRIENEPAAVPSGDRVLRVPSPRLVHPEQIEQFSMEVREVSDDEL